VRRRLPQRKEKGQLNHASGVGLIACMEAPDRKGYEHLLRRHILLKVGGFYPADQEGVGKESAEKKYRVKGVESSPQAVGRVLAQWCTMMIRGGNRPRKSTVRASLNRIGT